MTALDAGPAITRWTSLASKCPCRSSGSCRSWAGVGYPELALPACSCARTRCSRSRELKRLDDVGLRHHTEIAEHGPLLVGADPVPGASPTMPKRWPALPTAPASGSRRRSQLVRSSQAFRQSSSTTWCSSGQGSSILNPASPYGVPMQGPSTSVSLFGGKPGRLDHIGKWGSEVKPFEIARPDLVCRLRAGGIDRELERGR